jgi:hypothetical protein
VDVNSLAAADVTGLAFLVGRWRGTGEWGGKPLACRTEIAWLYDRHLQIDVVAEQDGRAAHQERILIHGTGDRMAAVLYPDRGDVQHFDVRVLDPGTAYRLVFTPPTGSALSPQQWTLRRTATGYEESFDIAPGGGAFQTSVRCAYVPEDTR